jgi:ubiquinone/menaquinone biosynthesis C-methylase UbiE
MDTYKGISIEKWAVIEAEEHDDEYRGTYPFGRNSLSFTVEEALWFEDYAYKKGRRTDRGDRTRKFLELVEIDSICGKSILDVGCGNGQYSVLLAKKGAHVTGVELSPVGIQRAIEMADANGVSERCTFIAGDFTRQEFSEEQFDMVLMHEVFHHAIKYPGLKSKIDRVTKPGGKIIIADGVRGDNLVQLGRRLVKYFRFRGKPEEKQQVENLGDVPLVLRDFEEFGEGFGYQKIYFMNYFYMVKETDLKFHRNRSVVRLMLRLARYVDVVFLTLFPFLRKRCSEVILYIEK